MRRPLVFVDTWAWLAAAVSDDPDHGRVRQLNADLEARGAQRVTSVMVLGETLTRLRYDVSHRAAVAVADAFAEMAAGGVLDLVVPDALICSQALDWFRRFDDQRFSFVDCTSFAIMAQRGISEALTGDRHFAAAGFVALGAI